MSLRSLLLLSGTSPVLWSVHLSPNLLPGVHIPSQGACHILLQIEASSFLLKGPFSVEWGLLNRVLLLTSWSEGLRA